MAPRKISDSQKLVDSEQEGSLKGYNPKKPGRPSHHPLVGFLAEGRRLLWATLRSGNRGSANGCVEFLKQALTV